MIARTTALLLAAAVATGLTGRPAQAQRVSPLQAGRFLQFCNTPRNNGQQICDAYITGLADSFALAQKLPGGGDAKAGICVPKAASGIAMRGRVVSWMEQHRDRLHDQVGEVVYQALHETFPCGGSGQ